MNYRLLSEKIVDTFIEVNWSENEKSRETCLYGIEALISTVLNFFIVIILGFVLEIGTEIAFYMMFFTPLRLLGGGRHAKNHGLCIGTYCVCMLIVIYAARYLHSMMIAGFIIIAGFIMIACVLLQWKYAGKTKQISKCDRIKYQRYSLLALGIEIAVIITMLIIGQCVKGQLQNHTMIALGAMLVQGIFLIPNRNKSTKTTAKYC